MGPYEQDRVGRAANQVLLNNPDTPEALLEQYQQHKGPLWDEAIAVERKASAPGELASFFSGVTAKSMGVDTQVTNQFWKEYIQLVSQYENVSPEVYRKRYHELTVQYPFAEYMLLSRRGSEERDRSYAYSVLSRIEPGKTDDLSEAAGFDYDIFGYFYDNKGDLSELNPKDRTKFMTFISELGAVAEIPSNATKEEWSEASLRYSRMREYGEGLFGEDIWELVDKGYELKEAGTNSSLAWQNYLDATPVVEAALRWQTEQIHLDPYLAAYYGSIYKLRSYGTGLMYQKIEDKFGQEIFNTVSHYNALKRAGLSDEAKEYYKEHPEIKVYYDMKDVEEEYIKNAIVNFGDRIPSGQTTGIRSDLPEELSEGEREIIDFLQAPETADYNVTEWRDLIGKEEVAAALMAYRELPIEEYLKNRLVGIAEGMGLSYDELVQSVGQAD